MTFRRFLIFLIPSTLAYFAIARILQDRFGPRFHPDMLDAYPGWPLLPESLEIPLYLFGYAVIPLLAAAGMYLWKFRVVKILTALSFLGAVAGAMTVVLRQNLPDPRFAIEYFQARGFVHAFWLIFTKRLYIVRVAFLFALGGGVLASVFPRIPLAFAHKLNQAKFWQRILPYLFVILGGILFHPQFPSQEGMTNFVLSPAVEILHGKALLYETMSQYGILSVYLVALLLKLGLPAAYGSIALIVMVCYLIFFLLLYQALYLWKGSPLFALVGTWLAVALNFLLLTDPFITPFHFPNQTIFRNGFYVVVFWLAAKYFRAPRAAYRQGMLAAAVTGVFWNMDSGLYLVAGTTLALAYQELRRPFFLRRLILLGLNQLAYLAGIFGVINVVNYFVYQAWPNWQMVWLILTTFENGFGKLPFPIFGMFEIPVLIYLGFLAYLVRQAWKAERVDVPLVFLCFYGIFSFIYYIGNSAWSYLNLVSLPAAILAWHALYQAVTGPEVSGGMKRVIAGALASFVLFFGVLTITKLPVVFAYRNYQAISLQPMLVEDKVLREDAAYLLKLPAQRLPMFHEADGKLLLYSGKINYFNLYDRGQLVSSLYSNYMIYKKSQVQSLANQALAGRPEYVVISKSLDPRFADLRTAIEQDYALQETLQTAYVFRRQK